MCNFTPQIPSDFIIVDEFYTVYGKTVKSNYPMPLQVSELSEPDVTLTYKGIVPKTESGPPNKNGRVWRKENHEWLLRYYNSLGHMDEFRFSKDGKTITCIQSWPEWRDTLFALMNPVMAAAVSIQGDPVLHASSLVLDGKSTLVMGISGAGKSTLSAALAVHGMSVHSDDIAVLKWINRKEPHIMAGYPRIKIEPGIRKHLDIADLPLISIMNEPDTTGLPQHTVEQVKRATREKWLSSEHLPAGFYSKPAPLNAIVILDKRNGNISTPVTELLSPMKATMALTEHIYGRSWLNPPGEQTLKVCARLAESIPVYKVQMPDNLDLLKEAALFIKEEIIQCS